MKFFANTIGRYAAHPDPLAAAANVVALVIAFDQPFYPFTLYWATGTGLPGSFLAVLSAPFFFAVPAVMRRSAMAGKATLVLVGTIDSIFAAKVFGPASGSELYLVPCLLLAAMLFRRSEQWVSFGLIALIFAGFGLHDHYGAATLAWSAPDHETLVRINAVSVAMLTTLIGVNLGRARCDG